MKEVLFMVHRPRAWALLGLLALSSLLFAAVPLAAAPAAQARSGALQPAFTAASGEFAVPESVLLAVSYNLSRWEHHDGRPSMSGGYGPMHLVDLRGVAGFDARGDEL